MNFYKAVAAASKKPAVSTSVPAQTGSLIGWWDPSLSSVGDTTVTNLAYTNGYTNIDYYQSGANGGAIVSLNNLNCWYLDGVNDRVGVNNLNATGTTWPLNTDYVEWTLEGWVRSNGSWISNGNWWNIGFNNAYRNRFQSDNKLWNYWKTQKITSATFATNTWHHITITTEANASLPILYGTGKIYRNGSLVDTFTNINTDPDQSGRTSFWGGFTSTQESGRFYMGMCRQYTTVLTASEVLYNYNLEKADYGY